jgi:hypothetical protein
MFASTGVALASYYSSWFYGYNVPPYTSAIVDSTAFTNGGYHLWTAETAYTGSTHGSVCDAAWLGSRYENGSYCGPNTNEVYTGFAGCNALAYAWYHGNSGDRDTVEALVDNSLSGYSPC